MAARQTPSVAAVEPPWPDDAVEVGRIVDAWGVKGWIKVEAWSHDPQALLASKHWFLMPPGPVPVAPLPPLLHVTQSRVHAGHVVAAARELTDRSSAEALRGARVHVSRAAFPAPARDEFYWHDLIGLAVVNRDGTELGRIDGLLETGAHDVLRVYAADGTERLIPFVAAYVDDIDLAARRVRVDWGLDY
ncbi:MAG: ribosome maturation factor RimM [Betaproteobacteria bacterium]